MTRRRRVMAPDVAATPVFRLERQGCSSSCGSHSARIREVSPDSERFGCIGCRRQALVLPSNYAFPERRDHIRNERWLDLRIGLEESQ